MLIKERFKLIQLKIYINLLESCWLLRIHIWVHPTVISQSHSLNFPVFLNCSIIWAKKPINKITKRKSQQNWVSPAFSTAVHYRRPMKSRRKHRAFFFPISAWLLLTFFHWLSSIRQQQQQLWLGRDAV